MFLEGVSVILLDEVYLRWIVAASFHTHSNGVFVLGFIFLWMVGRGSVRRWSPSGKGLPLDIDPNRTNVNDCNYKYTYFISRKSECYIKILYSIFWHNPGQPDPIPVFFKAFGNAASVTLMAGNRAINAANSLVEGRVSNFLIRVFKFFHLISWFDSKIFSWLVECIADRAKAENKR